MYEEFNKKYPLLFRNKNEMEPINMFGIECKEGWRSLLDTTFSTLYSKHKHHARQLDWAKTGNFSSEDKRREYIEECEANLKQIEEEMPIVAQCKEKFGELRLYCDNVGEYAQGVIDLAEAMSAHICENCSAAGSKTTRGWIRVLCAECSSKQEQ